MPELREEGKTGRLTSENGNASFKSADLRLVNPGLERAHDHVQL